LDGFHHCLPERVTHFAGHGPDLGRALITRGVVRPGACRPIRGDCWLFRDVRLVPWAWRPFGFPRASLSLGKEG
jgi:hypothetical protein